MSANFHFAEFCKDGRMDSALKYGRSAIADRLPNTAATNGITNLPGNSTTWRTT